MPTCLLNSRRYRDPNWATAATVARVLGVTQATVSEIR